MNSFDFTGKTFLVTGGSSGIGREVAITASKLGARLILIGRNEEKLKHSINLLHGSSHFYYSLDLTEYEKLRETIKEINSRVGSLDGFVHCAGIEKTLPLKLTTPEVNKEVFEINLFAGVELARLLSQKSFFNEKGASFVFISSIRASRADKGLLAYCSSKSALISGVKVMSVELASKGIRCNAVSPGIVETEMIKNYFSTITEESLNAIKKSYPLGLGKPSDVAEMVMFLLSEKSRWVTGSDFIIDGGYSAK